MINRLKQLNGKPRKYAADPKDEIALQARINGDRNASQGFDLNPHGVYMDWLDDNRPELYPWTDLMRKEMAGTRGDEETGEGGNQWFQAVDDRRGTDFRDILFSKENTDDNFTEPKYVGAIGGLHFFTQRPVGYHESATLLAVPQHTIQKNKGFTYNLDFGDANHLHELADRLGGDLGEKIKHNLTHIHELPDTRPQQPPQRNARRGEKVYRDQPSAQSVHPKLKGTRFEGILRNLIATHTASDPIHLFARAVLTHTPQAVKHLHEALKAARHPAAKEFEPKAKMQRRKRYERVKSEDMSALVKHHLDSGGKVSQYGSIEDDHYPELRILQDMMMDHNDPRSEIMRKHNELENGDPYRESGYRLDEATNPWRHDLETDDIPSFRIYLSPDGRRKIVRAHITLSFNHLENKPLHQFLHGYFDPIEARDLVYSFQRDLGAYDKSHPAYGYLKAAASLLKKHFPNLSEAKEGEKRTPEEEEKHLFGRRNKPRRYAAEEINPADPKPKEYRLGAKLVDDYFPGTFSTYKSISAHPTFIDLLHAAHEYKGPGFPDMLAHFHDSSIRPVGMTMLNNRWYRNKNDEVVRLPDNRTKFEGDDSHAAVRFSSRRGKIESALERIYKGLRNPDFYGEDLIAKHPELLDHLRAIEGEQSIVPLYGLSDWLQEHGYRHEPIDWTINDYKHLYSRRRYAASPEGMTNAMKQVQFRMSDPAKLEEFNQKVAQNPHLKNYLSNKGHTELFPTKQHFNDFLSATEATQNEQKHLFDPKNAPDVFTRYRQNQEDAQIPTRFTITNPDQFNKELYKDNDRPAQRTMTQPTTKPAPKVGQFAYFQDPQGNVFHIARVANLKEGKGKRTITLDMLHKDQHDSHESAAYDKGWRDAQSTSVMKPGTSDFWNDDQHALYNLGKQDFENKRIYGSSAPGTFQPDWQFGEDQHQNEHIKGVVNQLLSRYLGNLSGRKDPMSGALFAQGRHGNALSAGVAADVLPEWQNYLVKHPTAREPELTKIIKSAIQNNITRDRRSFALGHALDQDLENYIANNGPIMNAQDVRAYANSLWNRKGIQLGNHAIIEALHRHRVSAPWQHGGFMTPVDRSLPEMASRVAPDLQGLFDPQSSDNPNMLLNNPYHYQQAQREIPADPREFQSMLRRLNG